MPRSAKATILGLIALVFWATSVAFTRTLCEALGPFTMAAISYGGGGIILLGIELGRYRKIRVLSPPAWPYLIFCGIFFVGYVLGFVPSLAMAKDRQVALQLGVVNYLWPAFIVLGSVFILGYRARWLFLVPGIVVAFLGIAVCMAGTLSLTLFLEAVKANALAFALMTGSAVCWAVYSNCAHKYSPPRIVSGVPLFQLATGLIFLTLLIITGEKATWSPAIILPLAYYTVFVSALSYLLWDVAMQKGNIVFLGIFSYLLPMASTLFAGWCYHEPIGRHLLAGALLVMLGAILSRYGVVIKSAG